MRLKVFCILTSVLLWHVTAASASVTVGATRLIYDGASKEANLTVSNRDDKSPYLVQSWVSLFASGSEKNIDSFIVTPPLFRLDADKENILRVIFTGSPDIPQDKESLFLMNVKAIPAMSDEQKGKNVLQIALKTTIKLFYRPAGLGGSLKEAVTKLKWKAEAGELAFNNLSKFHIVVSELKLNGLPVTHAPEVIRPGEARRLPMNAKPGDKVSLKYIDDYGSTVDVPMSKIE